MRLGSLFAGIGGFELAATWAGITPVWSNEIEPFACKVLTKNFSHEIIQKDIREIGKHNLPAVDIISGGFPCQPFSQAGKRQGKEDDRYLWPEMLRVIRELRPSWVIGENVAGLLSMERGETLKRILADLEAEGYNNEVFIIPACGKGAWHKRERIWIVSKSKDIGYVLCSSKTQQKRNTPRCRKVQSSGGSQDATNTISNTERSPHRKGIGKHKHIKQFQNISKGSEIRSNPTNGYRIGPTEPSMGRVADGIPSELDGYWNQEPEGVPRVSTGITNRADRLKGLGNAIVPQVAYELFKAIHENVQG